MKRGGTREGVWGARFNRAAIGSFVVAGVLYGGAKTNGVNNLPPRPMMSPPPVVATVSPEDISRGWRVEGVATNAGVSYAMPAGVEPTLGIMELWNCGIMEKRNCEEVRT